jgi:serine/threonine protein kinase
MEKVFVDDVLARYPQASYLSRGGQKVVFSLTHHSYGEVVLKVGLYTSQSIRERIEREVKTLRSIKSDYFPICHEFELLENNRFLIIEERAKGEPLTQHLRDFSDHQSALLILNHLVNGLSQLWSNNIIHRDVKPDNIIICQDTSLRIIDLGIARLLDEDSLTQTFAPFGPCTPTTPLLNNFRIRKVK